METYDLIHGSVVAHPFEVLADSDYDLVDLLVKEGLDLGPRSLMAADGVV